MFDRKTYARSLSNATRNQRHNGITRARTSTARLRCSASRYDYLEPENIFSHIKGGARHKAQGLLFLPPKVCTCALHQDVLNCSVCWCDSQACGTLRDVLVGILLLSK